MHGSSEGEVLWKSLAGNLLGLVYLRQLVALGLWDFGTKRAAWLACSLGLMMGRVALGSGQDVEGLDFAGQDSAGPNCGREHFGAQLKSLDLSCASCFARNIDNSYVKLRIQMQGCR